MTERCGICGGEADESFGLFGPFELPDHFDCDTEVLVCFNCMGEHDLR